MSVSEITDRILGAASRATEIRRAEPEAVQELMLGLQALPNAELITLAEIMDGERAERGLRDWIDAMYAMRSALADLGGDVASSIPELVEDRS